MQKFSTLLLVLLLAASLAISGCDDTSPDNSSETTAADTTTAIPEETGPVQANGNLTLAADGESIFTIIRGENASANEIEAAKTFYQTLKTEMSISLPLSTDFVKKAKTSIQMRWRSSSAAPTGRKARPSPRDLPSRPLPSAPPTRKSSLPPPTT